MPEPIDFYFDFSSPYGYLASEKIDELAARHGRQVHWRPILLGVVFKHTGAAPLTLVPLKGKYSVHDFSRSARFLGLSYKHPANFPLATQRVNLKDGNALADIFRKNLTIPAGRPPPAHANPASRSFPTPPQAAPAETKTAVRIVGEGPEVQADSMVIGNVLTVGWDGQQLKNTWEAGPENIGSEEQIEKSGATFRAALTGFPVGSQVVVIEPGDGSPRVSVIDILAIA